MEQVPLTINALDSLVDSLLGGETDVRLKGVVHTFLQIALEQALLFARKQSDYGPANIAAFGEFGVLVRMNDKFERLKHLKTQGKRAKNESINDTYRDICNYAIIAQMLRRDLWPKA